MGFVPDEIRNPCKICVIAQNPGENEEFGEKPLIGRSGKIVENELAKYGITRENCSFLNIVHCRLNHTNALPDTKETGVVAENCFRLHTLPVLRSMKANIFVPLGDLALNWACGLNDIKKWRGSLMIPEAGPLQGKKVLPTIHPAFLFTDMTLRSAVKKDFARIARESISPTPLISYNDNFRIGVSAGEFVETLKSLKGKRVSLDIETTYDKPIDAKLKIIGIAWSKNDAMNYFVDGDLGYVLDGLSQFEGEFITATPYDYTVLTRLGAKFNWEKCHDVTLLHSRFDIESSHKIEYICSVFTERPYWKWMAANDQGTYNCLDCVAEWEAFDKIYTYCQLKDSSILRCYNADRLMEPIAVALHLNGLPVDQEMFEEEKVYYAKRREEIQKKIEEDFSKGGEEVCQEPVKCNLHKRYTGRTPLKARVGETEPCKNCQAIREFFVNSRPLNLRSNKQLIKKLESLGFQIPATKDKKSKEKKKSIAKGKLGDMLKKYGDPRLERLLEFKKMDTMVTRYFNEAKTSKDGRIHSRFSMHAAMHRWSSDEPNIQQMARPEEVG